MQSKEILSNKTFFLQILCWHIIWILCWHIIWILCWHIIQILCWHIIQILNHESWILCQLYHWIYWWFVRLNPHIYHPSILASLEKSQVFTFSSPFQWGLRLHVHMCDLLFGLLCSVCVLLYLALCVFYYCALCTLMALYTAITHWKHLVQTIF
jgi:hypothetical protein